MGASVGGYRLRTRVRAGGMAEVYLAEGPGGARVAIKRLLPHLDGDPRFAGWLREEARIGARLRHPNVVRLLGHGEEGGREHLVLEYVDGLSLAAVREGARAVALRRGVVERGAPLTVVASLLVQSAAAIDYVHRAGVVHSDVTPGNLLVTLGRREGARHIGAGLLKLCDFGVARERGRPHVGPIAGSPAYLAPEQARGLPGDHRSDVFALATCAWELLAGRRLFARSTTPATLAAVRRAEVPPPPSLAAWPRLAEVLAAAHAPDPRSRLASARTLGDAFLDWLLAFGDGDDAMGEWLGGLDTPAPALGPMPGVTTEELEVPKDRAIRA